MHFRFRMQYSLRTLLIGVTITAIVLGATIRHYRHRQAAIDALWAGGGRVYTEWRGPKWLEGVLHWAGLPIFEHATVVVLDGRRLTNVEPLLRYLEYLPETETLNLASSDITDQDMERVGRLIALRKLYLSCSNITDAGLVHLRQLRRLEYLFLAETNVTGRGLRDLGCMDTLTYLRLDGTRISDEGAANISRFESLTTLAIASPDLTDDGMEHISQLPHLETIELYCERVTDRGLERLVNVPKLGQVDVDEQQFSQSTMELLRRTFPRALINGPHFQGP
jgi:internalin A